EESRGLASDAERLGDVDRTVGVRGEDVEDVGARVGEPPAPVAAVPADRPRAGAELEGAELPDERAAPGPDRADYLRGVAQPEAGDDAAAGSRRPRRDAHEAERVVDPEAALHRGLAGQVVGRVHHPAPAPERRL